MCKASEVSSSNSASHLFNSQEAHPKTATHHRGKKIKMGLEILDVEKAVLRRADSSMRKLGQRQRQFFSHLNSPNVYFGLLPIQINQVNRLEGS